jgi:hypothetical protein
LLIAIIHWGSESSKGNVRDFGIFLKIPKSFSSFKTGIVTKKDCWDMMNDQHCLKNRTFKREEYNPAPKIKVTIQSIKPHKSMSGNLINKGGNSKILRIIIQTLSADLLSWSG